MRYIIDISPQMAEEVAKVVNSGKYKAVQDFVRAAIENQVYLETQDPELSSEFLKPHSPIRQASSSGGNIAEILALRHGALQAKTVPVSDLERPKYLWGQYNRFLPVKIVTRVAANLLEQRGSETLLLTELQEYAAEAAREFGKIVERSDRQAGRKRGTILSAGLPIGREQEKSKNRFKMQFVGHIVKDRMEGASPALKFIEIKSDSSSSKSAYAGITDFGLKFASFSNPILDAASFETPFSPEEVDFLLDHISKEVPEEAKLMQYILNKVKEGTATPDGLNQTLHLDRLRSWKHNEVITMRAGLVSRLSELGLLTRQKFGVMVKYLLTDLGEKYLAANLTQEAV